MPTRPSPRSERLGTPNTPAIRFTRGSSFEASLVRVCYGLSGCSPPWTDRTKFPWPTGDFYIQASDGSVTLPAAGYDYNSDWTPLLAGLSPAGMAASLAAPDLHSSIARKRVVYRAAGQNQARAFALSRTDGPEDVGRGGPLVLGGGQARAAFGPASRGSSARSGPHRRTRSRSPCHEPRPLRSPPDGRGRFFKSGKRRLVLRVMARTGRKLAIVHGPQLTRQRLLGDRDADLLPEPCDQIDQPPAHHAVDGRNGPLLDDGLQGRAMRVGEFRGLARRLAVDQALGPMGVELPHPVPDALNRDPAEPGRRGAGCSIVDRGQRQQPSGLRAILGLTGNRT